jgi:hypothetical protein
VSEVALLIVVFSLGVIVGLLVMAGGTAYMMRKGDRDVPKAAKVPNSVRNIAPLLVTAFVALMMFTSAMPTLAQEEEISLDIPVAVIFTQTNVWMNVFAPIAAIGIGIMVAIKVLNYVGKMLSSAF